MSAGPGASIIVTNQGQTKREACEERDQASGLPLKSLATEEDAAASAAQRAGEDSTSLAASKESDATAAGEYAFASADASTWKPRLRGTLDERRAKRLAMNRQSARARRRRKKTLIETLESQTARLSGMNQQFQITNEQLQARIRLLQQELQVARTTIQQLTAASGSSIVLGDLKQPSSVVTAMPLPDLQSIQQQPQQPHRYGSAAGGAVSIESMSNNSNTFGQQFQPPSRDHQLGRLVQAQMQHLALQQQQQQLSGESSGGGGRSSMTSSQGDYANSLNSSSGMGHQRDAAALMRARQALDFQAFSQVNLAGRPIDSGSASMRMDPKLRFAHGSFYHHHPHAASLASITMNVPTQQDNPLGDSRIGMDQGSSAVETDCGGGSYAPQHQQVPSSRFLNGDEGVASFLELYRQQQQQQTGTSSASNNADLGIMDAGNAAAAAAPGNESQASADQQLALQEFYRERSGSSESGDAKYSPSMRH